MAKKDNIRDLLTAINLSIAPLDENVNLETKLQYSHRFNGLCTQYRITHWKPDNPDETDSHSDQKKLKYVPTIYEYGRYTDVVLKLAAIYREVCPNG